jgi:hypothetical protein
MSSIHLHQIQNLIAGHTHSPSDFSDILEFMILEKFYHVEWSGNITPKELDVARLQSASKLVVQYEPRIEIYRLDIVGNPLFLIVNSVELGDIVGGESPYMPAKIKRCLLKYDKPVSEYLENLAMHVVAAFKLKEMEIRFQKEKAKKALN